jgi:hypothetical protein
VYSLCLPGFVYFLKLLKEPVFEYCQQEAHFCGGEIFQPRHQLKPHIDDHGASDNEPNDRKAQQDPVNTAKSIPVVVHLEMLTHSKAGVQQYDVGKIYVSNAFAMVK